MFIQNVSLADIEKGFHYNAGFNSMLIQIVDPAMEFPEPLHQFREVHKFFFADVEQPGDFMWEAAPTQEHADRLVELLARAKKERMNVIVHCVAGVCRSGAVCEIGVIMGFDDPEVYRSPNTLLKTMMLKSLGVSYDSTEEQQKKYSWIFDNEQL